eukprot:4756262-Amphidinium_carterae.1
MMQRPVNWSVLHSSCLGLKVASSFQPEARPHSSRNAPRDQHTLSEMPTKPFPLQSYFLCGCGVISGHSFR